MPDPQVTVYVPGLLDLVGLFAELPADDVPDTRLLERLLARANRMPFAAVEPEHGLFELFGVDVTVDATLPVAPVTYLIDAEAHESDAIDRGAHKKDKEENPAYMRADPVLVQPDRDELVMLTSKDLGLSLAEAKTLAADITRHFTGEDWTLEALTPYRWYLSSRRLSNLRTTPVSQVLGRNIQPYLPSGEQGGYWRGVLNEIQMLLHNHPINAQRESHAQPPINSLWFWGNGQLPRLPTVAWQTVWDDDVILHGLARLAGIGARRLPENALAWEAMQPGAAHLLVIDGAWSIAREQDVYGAVSWWNEFEKNWLAPLVGLLTQKRLADLTLICGQDNGFLLTRRAWRQFWKRRSAAVFPITPREH